MCACVLTQRKVSVCEVICVHSTTAAIQWWWKTSTFPASSPSRLLRFLSGMVRPLRVYRRLPLYSHLHRLTSAPLWHQAASPLSQVMLPPLHHIPSATVLHMRIELPGHLAATIKLAFLYCAGPPPPLPALDAPPNSMTSSVPSIVSTSRPLLPQPPLHLVTSGIRPPLVQPPPPLFTSGNHSHFRVFVNKL